MVVRIDWVWTTVLVWAVLDLLAYAAGWQDVRETGNVISRSVFFALSLRFVADREIV